MHSFLDAQFHFSQQLLKRTYFMIIVNCSQCLSCKGVSYTCISQSPAKHPNESATVKLRFNKNFHDVPPLCKIYKFTYPNQCTELSNCSFAVVTNTWPYPVRYLGLCETSMIEIFAKIANGFQQLTIFTKVSTTDF